LRRAKPFRRNPAKYPTKMVKITVESIVEPKVKGLILVFRSNVSLNSVNP